ncbi:MAG: hypothetical protein VKP57_08835 [Candidatus Sericytochromatia bacterium]|nr:hypothetical protein [Candidatus Sericytochromatia bacterium]
MARASGRRLAGLILATGGCLAGCVSAGPPAPADGGNAKGAVMVRVEAIAGRRQQATVRRWLARDVVAWRLSAVADGVPLADVILPAASAGVSTGGWRGLSPGAHVQCAAEALATTSPPVVISRTPATASITLGSGQDIEDRAIVALSVPLADRPFSGTVLISIQPPSGTSTVSISLLRQPDGLVDWEGELGVVPGLTCRITGLPVGRTWLARVRNRPRSCSKGGCSGPTRQAVTEAFTFDGSGDVLDDTLELSLGPWN